MRSSLPPVSEASRTLAALAVTGARLASDWSRSDGDDSVLVTGARLMERVDADTLRRFVCEPQVKEALKGAAAVGGSMAVAHGFENTIAGTDAMRRLGQSLLSSHPRIARILSRNPNAAIVAGTV